MLDYRLHGREQAPSTTRRPRSRSTSSAWCWMAHGHRAGSARPARRNEEKAALLYQAIDGSGGFYRGHAQPGQPLAHERHLPPAQGGAGEGLPEGSPGARARRPQGPPLGRRAARLDLQRLPDRSRCGRSPAFMGEFRRGAADALDGAGPPRGSASTARLRGVVRAARRRGASCRAASSPATRGSCACATEEGEALAARGRAACATRRAGRADLPAVGDWVALRPPERRRARVDPGPAAPAHAPSSAGRAGRPRRRPGARRERRHGLPGDGPRRRLQPAADRALRSSSPGRAGPQPVVLLNKADLVADVEARRARWRRWRPGVPVLAIAAKPGEGLDALAPWLAPGRTVGPPRLLRRRQVARSSTACSAARSRRRRTCARPTSAAGTPPRTASSSRCPGARSSSTRRGCARSSCGRTRRASRPRSTTSRALAPPADSRDCAHDTEPGCAVRAAVEEGRLDAARLESFRKLQAELRALEIREDPLKRREERGRWKAIHKSLRKDRRGGARALE